MNDPRIDEIFILHTIFGTIHLIYFIIYYGRYSSLNQKLTGIAKMERAGVVDQAVLDASRASIRNKIVRISKWCYLPILPIGITHLIWLINSLPENPAVYSLKNGVLTMREMEPGVDRTGEYMIVAFITIGSVLLIAAGNFVKGAMIFDPNKRFRNTGGPFR